MGFVYPIGTKVRLASGGPIMLVVDQDPRSQVLCAWKRCDMQHECWFPSIRLDIVRSHHELDQE